MYAPPSFLVFISLAIINGSFWEHTVAVELLQGCKGWHHCCLLCHRCFKTCTKHWNQSNENEPAGNQQPTGNSAPTGVLDFKAYLGSPRRCHSNIRYRLITLGECLSWCSVSHCLLLSWITRLSVSHGRGWETLPSWDLQRWHPLVLVQSLMNLCPYLGSADVNTDFSLLPHKCNICWLGKSINEMGKKSGLAKMCTCHC